MDRLGKLRKRNSVFWITIGCLFVAGIGVADVVTGSELAFALFYLIPIVLVTWFSGRNLGLAISVIAAITWFIADALGGQSYSQPAIGYWNATVRLGLFVVVTLLLPALRALEREREIARVDHLTGSANRRHCFEVAQTELYRSQRYQRPFTIAYIDLDDFKALNDQCGHRTGDKLLCAVVNRAKSHLRRTDLMARLGGDEFVLLLPEIDEDAAQMTVSKIQPALLDEVRRNDWPVTFSIGVLTYRDGPLTTDELITRADDLMYSVKKSGKNGIAFAVNAGETPLAPDAHRQLQPDYKSKTAREDTPMQVQVNTDNHIAGSAKLTRQVETLLEGALGRFVKRITRVEVYLTDESSTAKTRESDKRCVMEARLASLQPITVSHSDATLEQALDGAAAKLETTLDRSLGRLGNPRGRTSQGGDQTI